MKARLAFLILILICFKGFSQIETPKKKIKIAPIPDSKGTVAPSSASKVISYPSIFDKKDKLLSSVSLLKKKEEEPKSVFEQKEFTSQSKELTEKLNEEMKKEGIGSVIENTDFFYGEFKVYTPDIYIACRDGGNIVDGDNVAIILNGERLYPLITLEAGFRKYKLELKEGKNIIEILALNTGEYYPNTGGFVFFDGNEKLITNQYWNLNAGYKAVINIVRFTGIEPVAKQK